jgi:hypothetical protein
MYPRLQGVIRIRGTVYTDTGCITLEVFLNSTVREHGRRLLHTDPNTTNSTRVMVQRTVIHTRTQGCQGPDTL